MIRNLEKELNKQQLRAATTLNGPLLIIAGAGSGKTRVITYRIGLLLQEGVPQGSILALTFTNKAAREMYQRIQELAGKKLQNLTVSTFHAFGVRVLRKTIWHLGFRPNFSIYDQSDRVSVLKETLRENRLSPDVFDIRNTLQYFSDIKTGRKEWTPEYNDLRKLYDDYQLHLKAYNALEFDDLIVMPIKIFEENPDLLEIYRSTYEYILVDEFQDTSRDQYRIVRLLGETNRNVCVVGDDDQSIYSWRGADYENIVQFEKDFSERIEIKLEQNYRSTGTILSAANNVIANNRNRKIKNLWTGIKGGRPIELFLPEDEYHEAEFIGREIKTLFIKEGIKYHEIGVLVRTNSLIRNLEEAFLTENIPYRISGGSSFYQRQEVKDIISYLRVMANPDDDISLLRIINTPRRGLGRKTIEILGNQAQSSKYSLFSCINAVLNTIEPVLHESQKSHLHGFMQLIEKYRPRFLNGKKMAENLKEFVTEINYWGHLISEYSKKPSTAKWKFKNINLFIQSLSDWEKHPDTIEPDLYSFLNRITLVTRDDVNEEDDRGKVNLMTIHAAKGLEYEIVFLSGVEENIIPHARSLEESEGNLEEERRLFYVAITRAKRKLYMTACRKRKIINETVECLPSPFLEEIPEELIETTEGEQIMEKDAAVLAFDQIRSKFD
jgi:DNA helicase II / ATP-dependent DNA helicase PcrA